MSEIDRRQDFEDAFYHPTNFLSEPEVIIFANETIWPVVNFIWRGNFLQNSEPHCSIYFERAARVGSSILKFTIMAHCNAESDPDNYGEDEESVSLVSRVATIIMAKMVPEMHEGLAKIAAESESLVIDEDTGEKNHDEEDYIYYLEAYTKDAQAWRCRRIDFFEEPAEDTEKTALASTTYELINSDGESVWDDTEMTPLDYDGVAVALELEDYEDGGISLFRNKDYVTREDVAEIRHIIDALGLG